MHLNDLFPRMGASVDLFGTGKTAVKVTLGRYPPDTAGTGAIDNVGNPAANVATSTSRAWTDTNRNYVPDCDLFNPVAQNLTRERRRRLRTMDQPEFRQERRRPPPTIQRFSRAGAFGRIAGISTATVQHELVPRVSVELSYARRVYGNFLVTDNRAIGPADFDPFTVTAPIDSRLPGGGGNGITSV